MVILAFLLSTPLTEASAEAKIKCTGMKTIIDSLIMRPGGKVEESIQFEVSDSNGVLFVYGAGLPYGGFPISMRTNDTIYAKGRDKEGYDWDISLGRYSGKFDLFRSRVSPISGDRFVNIMISDAICRKQEQIM
jgi:hypothetical protein